MGFFETVLAKVGTQLVECLWIKLELKLENYLKLKGDIKAISNEATALKIELRGATSEAEYDAILEKISNFGGRIKL